MSGALPSYAARLYCVGCGRDLDRIYRAAPAHRRTSRSDIAWRDVRRAQAAAVCDRCRGGDRAARKAARRAELEAEAARGRDRRAELRDQAHALGRKYNAEHDRTRRLGHLVAFLAIAAELEASRPLVQLELFGEAAA